MSRILTLSILFLTANTLFADEVKEFTNARTAIAAATQQNKLIVFVLTDRSDRKEAKITEGIKAELNRLSDEFVLVSLGTGPKANRDLFTGRFGKDITAMPTVVISDSKGVEVASHQGKKTQGYERMVINARIKGGVVTDPVKLAALKESLTNVGVKTGLFGPDADDLEVKKVALTSMRTWKGKDGTTFEALLLEALGDKGNFVDSDGNSFMVKFENLAPAEITFLKTVLSQ